MFGGGGVPVLLGQSLPLGGGVRKASEPVRIWEMVTGTRDPSCCLISPHRVQTEEPWAALGSGIQGGAEPPPLVLRPEIPPSKLGFSGPPGPVGTFYHSSWTGSHLSSAAGTGTGG